RRVRLAVFALAAVTWLALLLLAPVLPVPLAGALYALGSRICHQRPERSFHLLAAQLPVCARCLGIYAGGAAGSLLATRARIRPWSNRLLPRTLLIGGSIPTALTLVFEWSDEWRAPNLARAAAGVPLGFVITLLAAQGAATR